MALTLGVADGGGLGSGERGPGPGAPEAAPRGAAAGQGLGHLGLVAVVLAFAAQGAWGWISLRRVEKVNRATLA